MAVQSKAALVLRAISMSAFVAVLGLWLPAAADTMSDADAAWRRQDFTTAAQLYRSLAEQGRASAQHALGKMYENGEGVPRDYVQAYMWFSLSMAAGQGDYAAHGRSDVMKKMTPAQIAQGDRLVSEWKPKKGQ